MWVGGCVSLFVKGNSFKSILMKFCSTKRTGPENGNGNGFGASILYIEFCKDQDSKHQNPFSLFSRSFKIQTTTTCLFWSFLFFAEIRHFIFIRVNKAILCSKSDLILFLFFHSCSSLESLNSYINYSTKGLFENVKSSHWLMHLL